MNKWTRVLSSSCRIDQCGCRSGHLLDGDFARAGCRRLGHGDGQDAVLQAGADVLLVDACREGEGTVELADGALADPVFGLVVVVVVRLLHLLALAVVGGGVVLVALARLRRVVLALGAALDDEGLVVGELDLDVLLRDAGQLAVQVVGVSGLAHVKARGEAAQGGGGAAASLAVDVVVVQQAEEGGEVAGAEVREQRERHGCACSGWSRRVSAREVYREVVQL